MKKYTIFVMAAFCSLFLCESVEAQLSDLITIETPDTMLSRGKTDLIIPIYIYSTARESDTPSNYIVSIVVKPESTMPSSAYTLTFAEKELKDVHAKGKKENPCYLMIKKDSLADRTRTIVLGAKYKRKNIGEDTVLDIKPLMINIQSYPKANDSISDFSYLAYIGTSFDLVDGQQDLNLFFASNVFLAPKKVKTAGMYLSLYGNRTMTIIDSAMITNRIIRRERTSDSTYNQYTQQNTQVRTQVADNLGAYVSPLLRLWCLSRETGKIQLYYAPSLEFVWRRLKTQYEFVNPTNFDTTVVQESIIGSEDYPNTFESRSSQFVFLWSVVGLMVAHESERISVRVHGSMGRSTTYFPMSSSTVLDDRLGQTRYAKQGDWYFCGRAWITEAYTGITLQAEITNNLKYSRPYYGVTLSKAFNFENLGNFFKPLTKRS